MSLVSLQREVAPAPTAWIAPARPWGARMINEIVLCEESDYGPDGQTTLSHFELYLEPCVKWAPIHPGSRHSWNPLVDGR